jgi:DNA-binding IclR family transcriptional regulator
LNYQVHHQRGQAFSHQGFYSLLMLQMPVDHLVSENLRVTSDQPIDRALALMAAVANADRSLSTIELAELCDLPVPTARRLVGQLETRGLLKRALGTKKFIVGPRLIWLGAAVVQASMRSDRTHQVLEALASEIGEHCQIGFRSGNEVVYADTARAMRSSGLHFEQGRRAPLYCSSTGKLFLAEMKDEELSWWLAHISRPALTQTTIVSASALRTVVKDVRAAGWALSNEEMAVGVVGCAVPLRLSDGRLVAGLGISVPKARTPFEALIQFRPMLEKAALEITRGAERG